MMRQPSARMRVRRCSLLKLPPARTTGVFPSGSGRICPSLSGHTVNAKGRSTGQFVFKCTRFEFCDEPPAVKLPFVVGKWKNMLPRGIDVSDGETVTLKASFEKAE